MGCCPSSAANKANENGATPLYIACDKGHVDAARLLLDKGAAVDRAREDGWTPLRIAKSKGHSAVVALLKEWGATEPALSAQLKEVEDGCCIS